MGDADSASRIVLVESSEQLPGLLPFQAWDILGTADEIFVRATTHPSAPHLYAAGLDLTVMAPAQLERADMDLSRPGSPEDRRIAKALLKATADGDTTVYLLGPDDAGLAGAIAGMLGDRDVEIELVFFAPQPAGTALLDIVEIMRRLRDPSGGCPWDLEQDHQTLVKYLIEETYELVDAIEHGEQDDLIEELGDVLLQVVFHAQVASDRRAFGIDDVARGIVDKLIARHPHVFAGADVESAADVQQNWDELKDEQKGRTGVFDGVPAAMPGLQLLEKVLSRAARADDGHVDSDPLASVRERVDGLVEAADLDESIGELLLAVVALARERGIDPEHAARSAAGRFRDRVSDAVAR